MSADHGQYISLQIDGARVPLAVRVNPRARRLILRFDAKTNSFVAVVPHMRLIPDVYPFAQRHRDWVKLQLGRAQRRVTMEDGSRLPIRGVSHVIENHTDARRGVWREMRGGQDVLCVSGTPEHTQRRVKDWLKREARADLLDACQNHAVALNLPLPKISVRDTYSRWGSCSHKDRLSFSWRLILSPPHVLDYVAAHESAHRIHMNHSRDFWRLTKKLSPQMEQAEDWLKKHGPSLFLYG